MFAPPGWYPDPSAPATVRYWTGQEWTAHTAPGSAESPYSVPATAASWPAQPSPWANPYAAESIAQPRQRTATLAVLGVVLAVVGMVISAEVSHFLTVRHEGESAAAAGNAVVPFPAPTYAPPSPPANSLRLPATLAGLSLDPQSAYKAHHLTTDAESQLSPAGSTITIGYYQTSAGTRKVFSETIEGRPVATSADSADLLNELETGYEMTLREQDLSAAPQPWSRVPTSDVSSVMFCKSVVDENMLVRACAFVQGSTIGIIGVYDPTPADEPLIDDLRRAIASS